MFEFPLASRFALVTSSPVRDLLAILGRDDVISFAGGIPDPTLFELDDIATCYEHVLATQGRHALQYASTEGEPALREQAARRLSRDLPTTADQIQITSGSQEGIFLTAQALLDPGDVVLVEQPTYLAAIQAFTLAGATLVPVDTDDHGVDPTDLEAQIREHHPKFVYLIPTFQNPTGRTMPLERRHQVTDVLQRTHTALVEDDPYSALRYNGEPVPPIAALDGMASQTILLNSASKIIAPGTRVGWIRAEGPILRTLAVAKQAVGLQSPVPEQLVIARYLETCDLDAHLHTVAAAYRGRRDAMVDALTAIIPDGASVTRPEGGMFCWLDLHDDTDTAALLPRAVDNGVAWVPGSAFHATHPSPSTMRLSFVTNDEATIAEGVRRMAEVLPRS